MSAVIEFPDILTVGDATRNASVKTDILLSTLPGNSCDIGQILKSGAASI